MRYIPSILLASGICLFVYAFRPCTDEAHYLRRILAECILLVYAVWKSNENKVEHNIAIGGLVLASMATVDELRGCGSKFSNAEDILGAIVITFFIIKLKSVCQCLK